MAARFPILPRTPMHQVCQGIGWQRRHLARTRQGPMGAGLDDAAALCVEGMDRIAYRLLPTPHLPADRRDTLASSTRQQDLATAQRECRRVMSARFERQALVFVYGSDKNR